MNQHDLLSILDGSRRGAGATLLRGGLSIIEPFYTWAISARNFLYDHAVPGARHAGRPVISVGNLTTGGTGKTPVIRWLAQALRERGLRVAILSRGYKSSPRTLGDEQRMLDAMLNPPSSPPPPIILKADPDRGRAAAAALQEHPDIDVFLLDDGFQHRRLARDLDIVLISAACPFGHGHVLPRGLLREPVSGIRRAGALIITHVDQVDAPAVAAIEQRLAAEHPAIPIHHAAHAPVGLRTADVRYGDATNRSLEDLRARRFFALCGIARPDVFERHLATLGPACVGHRWFADHHAYTPGDLSAVTQEAAASGADLLVTTEKDWVKLRGLMSTPRAMEIWRLDIELRWPGEGDAKLLEQVMGVMRGASHAPRSSRSAAASRGLASE